jgi:hypothetical protein
MTTKKSVRRPKSARAKKEHFWKKKNDVLQHQKRVVAIATDFVRVRRGLQLRPGSEYSNTQTWGKIAILTRSP